MELEVNKYRLVDRSPTIVLQTPRCSSQVAQRHSSGKPKYGDCIPRLCEEFTEDDYSHYFSESCRDYQLQRVREEATEVIKRSSVYQSSVEARLLQKSDAVVERKIIEFSGGTQPTFSVGIIDLFCNSDEDSSLIKQKGPSVMLSADKTQKELCSQDNMITSKCVTERTQEKVLATNLHRSKSAMPHSSAKLKSDVSKRTRFSPLRKMFDPFVRNKPQRSPLSRSDEIGCEMMSELAGGVNQQNMICRSYLNDIQDRPCFLEHNYRCKEKESCNLVPQCSPAHLHGLVKSRKKHGMRFFEFSVKSPEGVYVAKARKVENAFTWMYTFHSLHRRRMGSNSGWGVKNSNRELSLVGQLHISCQVRSEFKGAGEFNDFIVTEFVLYDIIRSRKSTSSRDNSVQPSDSTKAPMCFNEVSSQANIKMNESLQSETRGQLGYFRGSGRFDPSASHPLTAAELHPELEIAAIVIQSPFEKRESLKIMSGDKKIGVKIPHLVDFGKVDIRDTTSSATMHVLIPSGTHSLPITESCGLSPLLDRWRSGGGCDCGGWDMACPLTVFTNSRSEIADGQAALDNQNPAELCVQGRRDNVPAFTMRTIEDGKYTVDFHAQLSSLQAFSICVAILHAETSVAAGQIRSKQMLQSDLFSWDETKNGIADEQITQASKKMGGEVLSSFALEPLFSPVARA